MDGLAYRNPGESSSHHIQHYDGTEINPYPDPVHSERPTTLPILRIETETGEYIHRPESASVVRF